MWFTKRIWNFIQNTFETLGSTLDSQNYRLTSVEKDLVSYHNEHEEEIRTLKVENEKLRKDVDTLAALCGVQFVDVPAQPAKRIPIVWKN